MHNIKYAIPVTREPLKGPLLDVQRFLYLFFVLIFMFCVVIFLLVILERYNMSR